MSSSISPVSGLTILPIYVPLRICTPSSSTSSRIKSPDLVVWIADTSPLWATIGSLISSVISPFHIPSSFISLKIPVSVCLAYFLEILDPAPISTTKEGTPNILRQLASEDSRYAADDNAHIMSAFISFA